MKNIGLNILKLTFLVFATTAILPAQTLQASTSNLFEAARNQCQKNRNRKKESKRHRHKSSHQDSSKRYSYIKGVSQSGSPQTRHRSS